MTFSEGLSLELALKSNMNSTWVSWVTHWEQGTGSAHMSPASYFPKAVRIQTFQVLLKIPSSKSQLCHMLWYDLGLVFIIFLSPSVLICKRSIIMLTNRIVVRGG